MTQITLLKSDFEGFTPARYADICDCPIARAAKRHFPDKKISVGGYGIRINGVRYDFTDQKSGMYGTIIEYATYYKESEFADLLPKVIYIDYEEKEPVHPVKSVVNKISELFQLVKS